MRTIFSLAIAAFLALAGTTHGVEMTVQQRVSATLSNFQRLIEINRDNETIACSFAQESERASRDKSCHEDFASYRQLERVALEKNMDWQYADHYKDPNVAQFEAAFRKAFAASGKKLDELMRKYPKPYTTGQR